MALSPMEVQQKTFRESMRRGYDQGEVDDFLDEVVAALTEYEGRARAAEGRAAAMEAEVGRLREEREAVTEALVDARRRAQAVTAEARAEAERILESAKTEARVLAEDQVKERERLDSDLVGMRSRVSDLRSRLAGLATELDSQVDPLAVELDAAIGAGAEIAPQADPGAEAPETEQTEVLDLVEVPLPDDQTSEPEVVEPSDAVDDEPDEETPASIGAVEESLAVWGGGGARSRPWERGES